MGRRRPGRRGGDILGAVATRAALTATGGLRPLELACGLVLGKGRKREVRGRPGDTPRTALERAVVPSLRRPPCLVSFSGGRDSSAVLAVATHVARREGLPLPIPATNRFPALTSADESEWQERVVAHLALDEWVRIEHGSELECLGPHATAMLGRHGVLWPFNTHFHAPLVEAAHGGSLLTGIGGDELLSISTRSRVNEVLRGRARAEPRDLLRIGYAVSPAPLRRFAMRRKALPLELGWLTTDARAAFVAEYAAQQASQPGRWRTLVWWLRSLRYVDIGAASVDLIGRDEEVAVSHPFLDDAFVAAVAELRGHDRFESRAGAMRALFGDLLPDDVLTRKTKAAFDGAFWADAGREFARAWDGRGVDPDLVVADALRAEWLSESPDPRSFLLAQSLWLATADRGEQAVDRVV